MTCSHHRKASLLDKLALGFRDHDGYPLVSTCIIASTASVTAKEEKEQAVRVVVKRWPDIGQSSDVKQGEYVCPCFGVI